MKPDSSSLLGFGRLCAGWRRALVVVPGVLAFMLLVAASSSVRAQGFQGVEPGTPVTIDLKAEKITGVTTLPFDVPFKFTGTVTDNVQSIEGRALGFKALHGCEQALKKANWTCSKDTMLQDSGEQIECHASQIAAPKGEPGSRNFELTVTPLQPNRYYCFEFKVFSAIQDPIRVQQIQQGALAAVATVLNDNKWTPRDDTNQPQMGGTMEAVDALRKELIGRAKSTLQGNEVLTPDPGSFFSDKPLAEIDQQVGEKVTGIFTKQVNVVLSRDDVGARAMFFAPSFRDLSQSLLWKMISEALQRHRDQPLVDQILDAHPTSLDLIGLREDQIRARSETHTGDLALIWDASQFNPTGIRQDLTGLIDILERLATDKDLRQNVGLDEASLAERISQACTNSVIPDTDPICEADPITPAFFRQARTLANAAVKAFDTSGVGKKAEELSQLLTSRQELLIDLAAEVRAMLLDIIGVPGTTVADYETRATWYVGADLGSALAWDIEEAFLYAGTNIYFRPVNKKAHLRWTDFGKQGQGWTEFRKRFSVMIGLPQGQVELKNAEPLVQNKPILVGLGFRLTDFIRFTLPGALVFKEKDPNPLVDNERLAWSPFVSLSIDWNIAGTFQRMFRGVFNPGQSSEQGAQ